MSISVVRNGIEIDGVVHPLFSGCVQYWRLERGRWPEILDRAVEMGFKFICTYIPWSVHELEYGKYDFGAHDPDKDVGAFLDLVKEKGLFALVRPGPHINAEITFFGYPERVLKRQELLMRTADDTPAILPAPPRFFPTPSYASEEFYSEVGAYFDALCKVLAPRVHPNGPIVGVQSDNEMSFFFRTAAFDVDYSRPSIELYRKLIRAKYGGDIAALNRAYGSSHDDFDRVLPPRRFDARAAADLPYYLDWLEYKEYYLYHGIQRIARMLRERGLEDVFYFHNYPVGHAMTPYHVPRTEGAIDVVGVDLYKSRRDYGEVRDAARLMAGTSRLPFSPEFGSGVFPWWNPLFLRDQELTTRAAIMNGFKAMNFYMLADRDRWYGAPVARDGRVRPRHFNFYKNFNRFVREKRFNEFEMRSDVLLLCMRDYERLELASSLIDPLPLMTGGMPPEWFADPRTLEGFRDPIASLYRRQWRAFKMGFTQAGFPVTLADSEVELTALERFRVVVAPSFEFMDMGLQRRLLVFAFKGGVLVMGPRMPVCDETLRHDSKFASHLLKPVGYRERITVGGMIFDHADLFDSKRPFLGEGGEVCAYASPTEKGTIIHLGFVFQNYGPTERSPGLAAIMKKIAATAGLKPQYAPDDPIVETVLHERGPDRLLFVANPAGDPKNVSVRLGDREALSDTDTGETVAGPNAKIALNAYSVRIFNIHG
jgi:beta-galactosidase